MKKINCAFHSNQTIVNFCKNKQCLLPMCPNCIKVHSKEHASQNTFGQYQNIEDIYSQVQKNLNNVTKSLGNYSEELKQIYNEKQAKRQLVKKRMTEYRDKLMNSVQKYIYQLQNQILLSLGGQQTELQEQYNQIYRKIQNLNETVEKQIKLVEGQKTLKGLINHYSNHMPELYDEKMDDIELQMRQFDSKDVQFCKQFKFNQMNQIKQKINQLYLSIFKTVMKETNLFKPRQSRVSCKDSKISIVHKGTASTVKAH